MSMEHITEAVHMSAALMGGATLIHGLQARNTVENNSM